MTAIALKRTTTIAGLCSCLFIAGGIAACAGAALGGEFPLTATLWAMLLWPLAALSTIVWIVAWVHWKRHQPPPTARGFDVIEPGRPRVGKP
jgi:hypothetical protein